MYVRLIYDVLYSIRMNTTEIKQILATKSTIFHTDFARIAFETNKGKSKTWMTMMDLTNLGVMSHAIHRAVNQVYN